MEIAMKIEILEFYPKKPENSKSKFGSIKIKIDDKIVVCGVNVKGRKGKLYLMLPGMWGVDHVTKKRVRYPAVSFGEGTRKTLNELAVVADEFIEAWFKSHPECALIAAFAGYHQ